jgi:hypothetical protein
MSKKLTHAEYIQRVYILVNKEYEVLEKYVNTKTKLLMRHNICGLEYYVSPNKFLLGRRCPKCMLGTSIKDRINNFDNLCEKISLIKNGEFNVVGGRTAYKNNSCHILIYHNICKRKFRTIISEFLLKSECSLCNKDKFIKHRKKSDEDFIIELHNKFMGEYIPLENYINNRVKILMRHNICGNKWFVSPSNILRGYGCPKIGRAHV